MMFVPDTNILFSAIYNLDSNAGSLLFLAIEGDVELMAPNHVKRELANILEKKLNFSSEETDDIIDSLPVKWIEEYLYEERIPDAQKLISHDKDAPILACALALGTDIISGDRHFKDLKTDRIKVWKLKDAIEVAK